MKNFDLFSKRILIIALAISMMLLSGSIFLFSLKSVGSVNAKENNSYYLNAKPLRTYTYQADTINKFDEMLDEDIMAVHTFGIGIRDGNLYFGILYNNNTIGLHMAPADGEDVIPW